MELKILYKISLFTMCLFLSTTLANSQESRGEDKTATDTTFLAQKKKEADNIREAILYSFYDSPEEREKYHKGTFWFQRQFEDRYNKRTSKIAMDFLRKYPDPNAKYYFDGLALAFTAGNHPFFLKNRLSEERKKLLDKKRLKGLLSRVDAYTKSRAMPVDVDRTNQWLKVVDSLTNNFLQTNAPEDQKAEIERMRLWVYIRMTRRFYLNLNPDKKKIEADYWRLFDQFYWSAVLNKFDHLILKYLDYSKWSNEISDIISLITTWTISPELYQYLWEHYEEVTHQPELFKEHPALAEAHKKVTRTLKAITDFDETKPLFLKGTAMNGKEIDLEDYRGKVVLLDFWNSSCGPCIKEMPHVQALYEKYKAQGFEVIGIAGEGEGRKQQIQEIINRQGAKWPQVLDKSINAKINYHSLYKIHSLPTVWLLNKEGIIVDKNARGARLEPLIKKYLHLEQDQSS